MSTAVRTTGDRLLDLLPAIYRIRDAERAGIAPPNEPAIGPLGALLSVIAEQVAHLEDNLEQLYDDQFIETCADWVVPYIGDLLGYRPVDIPGNAEAASGTRAEVANTIGYRRQKGTAAVLEQLARDVTGVDAKLVEFFRLLAMT
ncbi:MAG TPA: hypothetical protein VK864_18315, partial [Longimicrobiales bacterium]|nr:hypothetical protein [Longimicrobiales bacterium]